MGIVDNFKAKVKNASDSAIANMEAKADDIVEFVQESHINNQRPDSHQMLSIAERREQYLQPQETNEKLKQELIERNLGAIGIEVFRDYLRMLEDRYEPKTEPRFDLENQILAFQILKWVTDSQERNIDKLSNVYQVCSRDLCTIGLIYTRHQDECEIHLAVANNKSNQVSDTQALYESLKSAIYGNFPGAELSDVPKQPHDAEPSNGEAQPDRADQRSIIPVLEKQGITIAVVSNLATEKSEGFISQSMEKLLDGIIPESEEQEYSILLLAQPTVSLLAEKDRLYSLYSSLSPLASTQRSESYSESLSETASANISGNLGVNFGINFGLAYGKNAGAAELIGKGESSTETSVNYAVKHTLELIERQIKRIEQCEALGMWNFAAYVVSRDHKTANTVSKMYLALTQGEDSYLEQSAVNIWDGEDAVRISKWLRCLQHPQFELKSSIADEWLMYPLAVNATTMLSGRELAYALNFPRKSVGGVPVYQCAAFGRGVVKYDHSPKESVMELGKVYHMRRIENNTVAIDKNSLTAHTFITGSTGTGKSNTVYVMLRELCLQKGANVHFLVIEPAKGEYKKAFGGYNDVSVYGTNYAQTRMLHLNPFSFPEGIQVLEHIDRLVEVFNACWPMYAAMPAVLKDAMEAAYTSCGWNLTSFKRLGRRFPTFSTLLEKLPEVMNNSEYSGDTKADYKGALVTRVKSLTNGINGQVFCAENELTDCELFDKNVIIDLSRVGSMETKALIMGILMIRQQEYRMVKAQGSDAELRHITVLEEAHNLLRRTSFEQSQDSSNLQGKSVEMLANAIAEMRTYGEGFVIADQSPGVLDLSVIRNTNTKIIMRLPDVTDRELVGRAAGLNDEQIVELAKLERGVATVYQNDWLEPVLCKVNEFKKEEKCPLVFETDQEPERTWMVRWIYSLLSEKDREELQDEDIDRIRFWISQWNIKEGAKKLALHSIEKPSKLTAEGKKRLLYYLVRGKTLVDGTQKTEDQDHAAEYADKQIAEQLQISEELARRIRMNVFLFAAEHAKGDELQIESLRQYAEGRGHVQRA